MDKKLHTPLPKKGDLGIGKNYKGITLTSNKAEVYRGLPLSCIKSEIEKILSKNQNGFGGE